MATPPKRKRLEKTADLPVSLPKVYCCRCGSAYSRATGNFLSSHSPMYRGAGHLPMCSNCVDEMYDRYRTELGSDKAAMRRICMKLDLYWLPSVYDEVERSAGVRSRVRTYIQKIGAQRFINKTYDDTIKEEVELGLSNPDITMVGIHEKQGAEGAEPDASLEDLASVSPDVIAFWGAGLTPQLYAELEERYKFWVSRYPEGTQFDVGEEALIRQICHLEVENNHARASGKATDKGVTLLNTLIGSLNLKPSQRTNEETDAELEKMPLGVGLQKWEQTRPLPPTPNELRDVNGIIKNVTTWFLGHACKMVGLKNSYTRMYEAAMDELRVKHPEYDEEDDDALLTDLFGDSSIEDADPGGDDDGLW